MTRTAWLVARSLRERPQDWGYESHLVDREKRRPYYLVHSPSRRQLWIVSRKGYYQEREPVPDGEAPWPKFGFFDQRVIHAAVEEWLAARGPRRPKPIPPAEATPADFGLRLSQIPWPIPGRAADKAS